MYNDLSDIINKSKIIILNDRDKYSKYLNFIENYLSKSDFIIGFSRSEKILFNNTELLPDEYIFDVYNTHIFHKLKKLTTLLYNEFSDNSIHLEISIDEYRYHLNVDFRTLLIGYNIKSMVKYYNIIYNNKNLHILTPELQLINIYYKLHSPEFVDDYLDLINTEQKMINLLYKNVIFYDIKMDIPKDILKNIIKELLIFSDCVIANNDILDCKNFVKPILISNDLELDISKIKNNKILKNLIINKHDCDIPFDCRIKKISLCYKNFNICDIYNCGEYNLIPYNVIENSFKNNENNSKNNKTNNTIKSGSPPVLLKFMLIDMWYDYYKTRKYNKYYMHLFLKYQKYSISLIKNNIKKYFPLNFYGVYQSYESYLKQQSLDTNKGFKFIPCLLDSLNSNVLYD